MGGTGQDRLLGGAGDDELRGGEGDDYLVSGEGLDRLYGQAGGDFLQLRDATAGDVADGGDGFDRMEYSGSAAGEVMDASGGDLIVNGVTVDLIGIEALGLYGGDGDDALTGSAGDDLLDGSAGDDELYGGEGRDTLEGSGGLDRLYGQADDDFLRLSDAAESSVADGGDGFDQLQYIGSAAGEVMDASGGSLVVNGVTVDLVSIEVLLLYGLQGDDRLVGRSGSDHLIGGKGTDTLNGGLGEDNLFGQDDADRFIFGPGWGHDWIFDFEDGATGSQDLIDVSAYGITSFDQLRISGNTVDLGASAGGTVGVDTVTISFSAGNVTTLSSEDFIFAA